MNEEWMKVKSMFECTTCECCLEPWCEDCEDHYDECSCVGPTQDGYEFKEVDGLLYAKKIKEDDEDGEEGPTSDR